MTTRTDSPYLLAIDIGGTSIRVAIAQTPGAELHRRSFSTPDDIPPAELADRIAEAARSLMERYGVSIAAGGAAVAGTVDHRTGIVVESPNVEQFRDTPLRDLLADRLGVPMDVENDANVAALGEHRLGTGRRVRHMVYLTISTGVGGGIIADGKLYRGAAGGAGEIGHMTIQADSKAVCGAGHRGCLEALASGTAIAREAQERLRARERSLLLSMVNGEIDRVSAIEVFDAARQQDRMSRDVIEHAIFYLAVGLADIVNIFNPEVIVLGGGVARGGADLLIDPAVVMARQRSFKLHDSSVQYRMTKMGDDNGLRGALVLADELTKAKRRSEKRRQARLAREVPTPPGRGPG
jgi:glucokinase